MQYWTNINKSYGSLDAAKEESTVVYGVTQDGTAIRKMYVQGLGTTTEYNCESLQDLFDEVSKKKPVPREIARQPGSLRTITKDAHRKLEQSEKAKTENIQSIIDQRLEQLLKQ